MTQKKPTPRRSVRTNSYRTAGPRGTSSRSKAGTNHSPRSHKVSSNQASERRATKTHRSQKSSSRSGHASSHSKRAPLRTKGKKNNLGTVSTGPQTIAPSPLHDATSGQDASRPSVHDLEYSLDSSVHIPAKNGHFPFTRRQLLAGGVALGAVALGVGGAVMLSDDSDETEITTLEVSTDAVFTQNDIDDDSILDSNGPMSLDGEYELPYGTLVWATSGSNYAACLLPTDSSSPLTQAGVISLADGSYTVVLDGPVSEATGYDIYDVRCEDGGIVWVEANCLTDEWCVYQATLSDASIGEPVLVDQGQADYDIPSIATAGGRAFWQVLPDSSGSASKEDSLLKSAAFGQSEVAEVWRSSGRMSTSPYSTGDGIVITPRVDASRVYYQLTLLNAEDGQMLDSLILPTSMAPMEAGYVDGRFTFCFENIYSYGDGIANLGTYVPVDQGGGSGDSWFRFERTPFTAPAWTGTYFLVKSTMAIVGVDISARTMFSLEYSSACDDYGDYLATTGTSDTIVTYTSIPASDDDESGSTLVRVWKYSEA